MALASSGWSLLTGGRQQDFCHQPSGRVESWEMEDSVASPVLTTERLARQGNRKMEKSHSRCQGRARWHRTCCVHHSPVMLSCMALVGSLQEEELRSKPQAYYTPQGTLQRSNPTPSMPLSFPWLLAYTSNKPGEGLTPSLLDDGCFGKSFHVTQLTGRFLWNTKNAFL